MAEFSLELNDDQIQLRDWIHGFARDVMRPAGEEWDEKEEFPYPIVEEADIKLGAFCSSEPDAGSDVSGIRTKATYDEAKDEWTLNGTKTWITNGGIADVHVVVAVVDPGLGSKGHASFIVPAEAKLDGTLRQGQKFKKHGIRASHTAEVVLEDVKIPGSFLLGGKDRMDEKHARLREGGGGAVSNSAMKTFESTRPAVGAQAVGIARAAYEYSLEYAKERVQFGRPIIQNQSIAFMLADMLTEIDASRLLVHRAAWLARNGEFKNAEGSMAKLKAGRTATWVTERAIQILGGYGYVREYPVERFHRDAKIHDIFEGTEQIQQLVIRQPWRRFGNGGPECGRCAATPAVTTPGSPHRCPAPSMAANATHSGSPRS